MRSPLPRFLGVLAILATALLGAAGAANASTINVCSACPVIPNTQFPDIQSAVNVANPGDVIDVGPGTFAPAVINQSVTLTGTQAGNDGRGRTPLTPPETVITGGTVGFDVNARHVTIDGFTFTSGEPGVWLRPGFSDSTVVNNVFFDNTIALYVASDGLDPTVIRHNKFELNNFAGASSGNGIYGDQGAGRVTIDENSFLGNDNAGVLFTNTPGPGFANEDIRVTDNTFGRSNQPPNKQNGAGVILAKTKDALVRGNTMDSSNGAGVYLEATKGVDIVGNTIKGAAGFSAIRLNTANFFAPDAIPNQDVSVIGNDIADNVVDNGLGGPFQGYGIRVSNGANLGVLEAHFNRIVGNGVGIRNEDTDAGDRINAENNWWGCNEGPNTADCDSTQQAAGGAPGPVGDAIVDSDPWLVLGVSSQKNPLGLNGQTSKISAGLRQNSDGDQLDAPPVPDKPVAFATTLGAIAPPSDVMHLGGAFSQLTSGTTAGAADVTAALDNEVAHTTVTLADPPPPPQNGTPGATGAQGSTGPQGLPGPQGPAGAQGLPAPVVAAGDVEPPADTRVVGCSLSAPASAALSSSVRVKATCEEAVRYSAEGTVAVPFTGGKGERGSARRFTLRTVRTQIVPAGRTTSIRMLLSDSVITAARRGLKQGRRSSVRIKVTATDAAGNNKTMAATVRLR